MALCACDPSTGKTDWRIPGVYWPASGTESLNTRFHEKPCLICKVDSSQRVTTQVDLWHLYAYKPVYMYIQTHREHTCAHTNTHKHTNKPIYINTDMYTNIYINIYIYTHTYTHIHKPTFAHMYIHEYIHGFAVVSCFLAYRYIFSIESPSPKRLYLVSS